MKYIRKGFSVLLIFIMLTDFTANMASANSGIIYETSSKYNITSGATLEKITRFTTAGWLNINVLRVDLSNQYINIDTLTNSNSINKLTTVPSLAKSSGAVAAVNASFFNFGGGDAIGPFIQSGSISEATADFNQNKSKDTFATVSVDKLNKILFDYWKMDISLVLPNGDVIPVGRYNKPYYGYTDLSIVDRKMSSSTIGTDTPNGSPGIVEAIVDNGKVTEIRQDQPSIPLPSGSYEVVSKQQGGKYILNNFKVGDSIQLDIKTTPDWKNLKTAVSGGAMLIINGKIPQKFSQNPSSGRDPRTAIGSSGDGKQLMLVTVDGRQDSSIGVTQTELAQFMQQLGAYNAMNCDGGGSTTMVARTPGTNDIHLENSPSDGSPRSIATALGVFSIAPPAPLEGLIISSDDSDVFAGTSRQFYVKGYDRYFNPVDVDPKDVKWSVSGVPGSFKDNKFYPASVGSAVIKASVGNVSSEQSMSVLNPPTELQLNTKTLKLAPKETYTFSVSGMNKNGYRTKIDPADIRWSVKGNIGSFDAGTYTASGKGTGYIDGSIGTTHTYCAVSVAASARFINDKFESNNASFTSYPSSVSGSYSISAERAHSGNSSGKLTYDFSDTEGKRAAYIVFPNNGIELKANTTKVGIWVLNSHNNSNWVGAWVNDAKGTSHTVYFTKSMDWFGWRYLEASLDDINSPSKLTRLYVVQPNPTPDAGEIYFDDLIFTRSSYPQIDASKIPQDTQQTDEANKAVSYSKKTDYFNFSVFGQSQEPGNKDTVKKSLLTELTAKINKGYSAAAFVGDSTHAVTKSVKKPVISTNTGYKTFDIKNSRFIQLDISAGGLRTSNANQWSWLLQQLNSFKGSNIFLFLSDSPGSFNDDLEQNLFKDILTQTQKKNGANIWVFYQGSKNTSYMENGIKYISTSGYDVDGLTAKNTSAAKYVLVTVKGSTITYEFKPVK